MKKFSFSKEYKLFNLKRNKSSQVAEEEVFESSEAQKIIRPVFNRFTTWLQFTTQLKICLLYTSPSPRDRTRSRMPSSA